MKTLALLAGVLFCAGCSNLDMPRGEMAYQALHLLDTMQTLNGPASDPCYYEADPFTRRLIGRHPSRDSVLIWGVALAAAHWAISDALEERGPEWALPAWQVVSTGTTAGIVAGNYRIGIKIAGDNDHTKHATGCL